MQRLEDRQWRFLPKSRESKCVDSLVRDKATSPEDERYCYYRSMGGFCRGALFTISISIRYDFAFYFSV